VPFLPEIEASDSRENFVPTRNHITLDCILFIHKYANPKHNTLNLCIVKRIKCNNITYNTCLTLRLLMSYMYEAPILDVSRSHTTTQHSR
jgi:hypothetical protein